MGYPTEDLASGRSGYIQPKTVNNRSLLPTGRHLLSATNIAGSPARAEMPSPLRLLRLRASYCLTYRGLSTLGSYTKLSIFAESGRSNKKTAVTGATAALSPVRCRLRGRRYLRRGLLDRLQKCAEGSAPLLGLGLRAGQLEKHISFRRGGNTAQQNVVGTLLLNLHHRTG